MASSAGVKWYNVRNSTRIVAEAYLPEKDTILVRFHDGVEWAYERCPERFWKAFREHPRGEYIALVLDTHPNRRWRGSSGES